MKIETIKPLEIKPLIKPLKLENFQKITTQKKQPTKINQEVINTLNDINFDFKNSSNIEFNYTINKNTNEVVVAIVDTKTKEVIREIPSKNMVELKEKMIKIIGMLVDRKF